MHRFLIRGTIEQKMHVLIKSLDTHGLSKNSEDSVLTIGDLSALFSQQTDEDTEEMENVPETYVVNNQSVEHQSTGNNVLVEQNDHVDGSDELPSTSREDSIPLQDGSVHVTKANEMPSTFEEISVLWQNCSEQETTANEMPSVSEDISALGQNGSDQETTAKEMPSTSEDISAIWQDGNEQKTTAKEMPSTSEEVLICIQNGDDFVTTDKFPSTSEHV